MTAVKGCAKAMLRSATAGPGSATARPGSATARPGSATARPGSATARPVHEMATRGPVQEARSQEPAKLRRGSLRRARSRLPRMLPPWIETQCYGLSSRGLQRFDSIPSLAELTSLRDTTRGQAELRAAANLAQRLGAQHCVQLYSDGASGSPWPIDTPSNMRLFGLGRSDTKNAAIVEARIEDPWPGPMLRVELALRREGATRLRLRYDGRERVISLSDPELEVEGDRVRIDLPRAAGGDALIALEPGGALGLDDALQLRRRAPWSPAIATLPKDASKAVGAVADYLERALAGRRVADAAALSRTAEARLLVVEGGGFDTWPKDGVVRLLFGTSLPGLDRDGPWDGEAQWSRSDALLRGLDLSLVSSPRRLRPSAALPSSARVLARLGNEPLLIIDPLHRLLWFACDLRSSSLGRQVFLPLLLLRALAELAPVDAAASGLQRTGIVGALLDARESQVAARSASREATRWFVPAREFWPWLLMLVVLLLLVLPFL